MTQQMHTPGPWRVEAHNGDIELVGHPTWPCRRYGEDGEWTLARIFDLSEDRPGTEDETGANARLIATAPDLLAAASFAKTAMAALVAYEADYGEPLPDDHEIGRIDDSRGSASFRIQVGHIRRLANAVAKSESRP